jgi:AcrR family transcriptional regulator
MRRASGRPKKKRPVRARNPRGQGGRLRTEIIDAATRLLASGGEGEPLSLRAVAREIGVAPQSVYLQFQTKSDLLLAVVEMFFAELQRHVDKAKAGLTDARARLRAHCLAYCDYGLSSPGHYKLLFESRLTSHLGIGYRGSPGSRVFESFLETVRQCVSPRISAPELFRETVVLWAELHGVVSLRWSKPGFPWPPAETMVDRVLEALNLQ